MGSDAAVRDGIAAPARRVRAPGRTLPLPPAVAAPEAQRPLPNPNPISPIPPPNPSSVPSFGLRSSREPADSELRGVRAGSVSKQPTRTRAAP